MEERCATPGGAAESKGPPPIGNALFFAASMRKSSFICASFSGIFGGEIVGLAPVLAQVVKLPGVLVRRPLPNARRQSR